MDAQIKQEPDDTYAFESMFIDPPSPSSYSQPKSEDRFFEQKSMSQESSTSSMKMDLFTNLGALPLEMKLKPVTQYLEDDPLPVKQTKPPAREIPQTFSRLPASVKQDPRDLTKVVGERANTSYVADLYEYIQGHCPKYPVKEFIFEEPHQQQFTVVLRIRGLPDIIPPYNIKEDDLEETPMLFPSKKAAKEYAASMGIEALKNLPVEPEVILVGPGKLKVESPMGELNSTHALDGYCSQNALQRPHILDTSNSKPPYFFGCEITIDINGERNFGDPHPNYQNKTLARNAAAQAALDWIARESPRIIKTKGKGGKAGRVLAPGTFIQIDATGKTIGEVASEACALLGFKAPQRELIPIEQLQGMYNVYITLEHSDTTTRVGPIKNVFGQKAASKEAMKATLRTVQYLAESKFQVKLEIAGKIEFDIYE
ncbi:hypothetical protein ABW20_dc0107923 [Dactylellina cionopaga]|nr:hypothetical protein ABW20_dc0107923 [Dactylellina cionopaga]